MILYLKDPKWTKQNFFTKWQKKKKEKKNILTNPGHKENATQNHTKILPHSC
jgi:hypothetical protein